MIQFPKNERVTLPSVEGAFGSMNIMKDPPKSITLRYKEKITDTQQLVNDIEASGDRISELINPYARGTNPMVSVNYGNYGTMGGQTGGVNASNLNKGQSYLPYRVMREGAFRPPITPIEQLTPLSRLPRGTTSVSVAAQDSSKCDYNATKNQLSCKDLKEIRKELIQACAGTNLVFQSKRPENDHTKIGMIVRGDALNAHAQTNKVDIQHTMIAPDYNKFKPLLKSQINANNVSTNISRQNGKMNSHENTIELERNRPICNFSLNKCDSRVNVDNSSKQFTRLLKKVNPGGMQVSGYQPLMNRENPKIRLKK